MEIKEQFYRDYLAENNIAEATKTQFDMWWKRILKAESAMDKPIDQGYGENEWREFLMKCSIRSVSTLNTIKTQAYKYLRYLVKNGIVSEDCITALASVKFESLSFIAEDDSILYFKNVNDVTSAIEVTMDKAQCKFPERDPDSYLPHIAAVYLYWYGLTDDEIVSLEKRNVSRSSLTVGDKVIAISDKAGEVLVKYRDSDGYTQKAKGIITLHYLDSDYLFRTYRKTQLRSDNLKWLVADFNRVMDGKCSLMPEVIGKSGRMHRYFMAECESQVTPALPNRAEAEAFFCEKFSSEKDWQNFVREYSMYKKLYH